MGVVTIADFLKIAIYFASEFEETDEYFRQYGFNVSKDLKECDLTSIEKTKEFKLKFLDENAAEISDRRFKYLLSANSRDQQFVVKTRLSDPIAQKGKSHGYRVVYLVDYVNSMALIFQVSMKKNNTDLSQNEKNGIKKMMNGGK